MKGKLFIMGVLAFALLGIAFVLWQPKENASTPQVDKTNNQAIYETEFDGQTVTFYTKEMGRDLKYTAGNFTYGSNHTLNSSDDKLRFFVDVHSCYEVIEAGEVLVPRETFSWNESIASIYTLKTDQRVQIKDPSKEMEIYRFASAGSQRYVTGYQVDLNPDDLEAYIGTWPKVDFSGIPVDSKTIMIKIRMDTGIFNFTSGMIHYPEMELSLAKIRSNEVVLIEYYPAPQEKEKYTFQPDATQWEQFTDWLKKRPTLH